MRVVANLAMSLDGRLAPAEGPVTFGGAADRARMAALRAAADVVLTGGRTFCDWPVPPRPLVRWWPGVPAAPPPALFVVTRSTTLIPRVLPGAFPQADAELRVFGTEGLNAESVAALGGTAHHHEHPVEAALDFARARHARLLLVEAGWGLVDALLRSDSVDELRLTISPQLFGGPTGVGPAAFGAALRLDAVETVQDALFLRFSRASSRPLGHANG